MRIVIENWYTWCCGQAFMFNMIWMRVLGFVYELDEGFDLGGY